MKEKTYKYFWNVFIYFIYLFRWGLPADQGGHRIYYPTLRFFPSWDPCFVSPFLVKIIKRSDLQLIPYRLVSDLTGTHVFAYRSHEK